ncbi:MAG TPA: response regulator transcription factor [Bacteroidetes bacterium]|nr:response regulator transcription factor [Bacteroidota bacterium]
MMKYKILIVEDEPEIVKLIQNRLDKNIYDVSVVYSGDEALKLIQIEHFDLLSLDIMLPSVDGLTLCNEARKRYKDSLIVIVSALDIDEKKEKAYELGADDYIAKPFSPKMVALKISSLLKRRSELRYDDKVSYATIQQHKDLKRFYIENHPLSLTVSEYTIFETLFLTPQKVFSKEDLSQILYNNDIGNIDKKGIGTHIYQLRKKIAQYSDKEIIKTVRNMGYTLYED